MRNPFVPVCMGQVPRGFAAPMLVLYAHSEVIAERISANGVHDLADFIIFLLDLFICPS